jgi:LPXTG-motif cell wall-anchored protein
MVRLDKAASLAFMIAALLGAAGFISAARAVAATGPAAITDPTGDVINRDSNAPVTSPPTDIVAATVDSGAGGIVLTFRTQQMGDPATDANWASPNTFVSWQVDSNGDGKVDDLIRYSADRTTPGGIASDLTHWSGPGVPAKHCDATAAFSPTTGYTLTFAPACIGNPASISYRVQLTYDTDLAPTKPVLAFDVAPDQGLAGPVPIFIPTAPAVAPPAGGAPAPAASAPPATPGGAPAPAAKPSAAKPAAKPAPKPAAKPAAPVPARPASAAPAPVTAPAAPAGGSTAGALAATGTNSTRWLAGLGGVFLLLGGLSLMADRRQRRTA